MHTLAEMSVGVCTKHVTFEHLTNQGLVTENDPTPHPLWLDFTLPGTTDFDYGF